MVRSFLPGALISTELVPPWPFLPWQTSHFCAKIAAPWAAVPLPGGRPLPSGPMLMSQSARSASVTFWPRPGPSAAIAVAANSAKVSEAATVKPLRIGMLCLPIIVDRPARDHIHVAHREGDDGKINLRCAALGQQLGARRLHVTGFIPGTALQHHRLAVPAPGCAETGQRLAEHRRVKGRRRPAVAAVGRNHDLGNTPIA